MPSLLFAWLSLYVNNLAGFCLQRYLLVPRLRLPSSSILLFHGISWSLRCSVSGRIYISGINVLKSKVCELLRGNNCCATKKKFFVVVFFLIVSLKESPKRNNVCIYVEAYISSLLYKINPTVRYSRETWRREKNISGELGTPLLILKSQLCMLHSTDDCGHLKGAQVWDFNLLDFNDFFIMKMK